MPLMSKLGITRLCNVTGLDTLGLPVYMAVRPNSRSLSVSQGKGFDRDAAKASALMETIELWHAENIISSIEVAPYPELSRTRRVLDPRSLPIPAYRTLRLDAPVAWVEGWELMGGEPIWVPLEIVSMDSVRPLPGEEMFFQCSNGLSSGNGVIESALHGLCELIERDAMVLWFMDKSKKRTKATQIDPTTIDEPHCLELMERIRKAGAHFGIWDLTTDVGIPTYAAVIVDSPGWRAKGTTHGFGTHLSPGVAISRALTEAAQCRLTEIAGSRDDIPNSQYRPPDEARLRRTIRSLYEPAPQVDFKSRNSLATATCHDDLAIVLRSLRDAGIAQAVCVDLGRPELGTAVTRLIVPGLEAYAHGIPVSRGKRAQRRSAELDALNRRKKRIH